MVCFQHASAPASLEVESTDRLVRFNVPSASSLLLVSNVSSDASRRFDDPHCHAHQFGHTILLLRSAMFRGGKRDIAVEIIEIS